MMRFIWKRIDKQEWSIERKRRIFVLFQVLVFSVIGICMWWLVGVRTLKTVDWFICFIGYPGFFGGYLGGIIFLWRQDT